MEQTRRGMPGGERGPFPKPPTMPTTTPKAPRPRTDAQRAVAPGRIAHQNSRNQGWMEGNRFGRTNGEAIGRAEGMREGTRRGRLSGALAATVATGVASMIADKAKKTQSETKRIRLSRQVRLLGDKPPVLEQRLINQHIPLRLQKP